MSEKSRSRKIQHETGIPYTMALCLVRGTLVLTPRSRSCIIARALSEACKVRPLLPHTAEIVRKPCPCFECEDRPDPVPSPTAA